MRALIHAQKNQHPIRSEGQALKNGLVSYYNIIKSLQNLKL